MCFKFGVFIIFVIIGEGMLGGVVLIVIVNCVYMLEYLIYFVIFFEVCLFILWWLVDRVKDVVVGMKLIV